MANLEGYIPMDGLFHHNPELHRWERLEKVQEYKGHKIESITYHREWLLVVPDNHRAYRVTFPSGRVSYWDINKRGGNIKALKEYIDFNIKYNRTKYL